jgi:hypothetical protein
MAQPIVARLIGRHVLVRAPTVPAPEQTYEERSTVVDLAKADLERLLRFLLCDAPPQIHGRDVHPQLVAPAVSL